MTSSWLRKSTLLALVAMASCATAVDDGDEAPGTGGSVSGDGGGTSTGGTTSTGGVTSGSGGVFGAGGNLGGASSGGVSSGGTSSGGTASGGTATGGASGGSDTGGATSGGGTGGGATGECADLPTYAEWKAGSGQKVGDKVVFSCSKAQGSCTGRPVGSTHIFICDGDDHLPNCTSQAPDDGSAWDHDSECP